MVVELLFQFKSAMAVDVLWLKSAAVKRTCLGRLAQVVIVAYGPIN